MSKMVESDTPYGVVFCGGEGTRLVPVLPDGTPKPLMRVDGDDTLLDAVVRQQRRGGISHILIVASERNADAIRSHCREHTTLYHGVAVTTTGIQEKRGLGSILSDIRGELPAKRPIYKADGDVLHFRFDPQEFVRFHETHSRGSTALMTRWGAWKHFVACDSRSGRIYAADTYDATGDTVLSLTGTVIIGRDHRRVVYRQPDTKTLLRSLAKSGQFFGFRIAGPSINVNTSDDCDAARKFLQMRPL